MPYIAKNDQPKYFDLNGKSVVGYYLVMDAIANKFTGIVVFPSELKYYYTEGKIHRLGGPAVEYADGYKEYWINDEHVTKEAHDLLWNLLKLKEIKMT